jgi:hypothetical protein
MMKKLFLSGLLIAATSFLFAQDIDKIINGREVERIEKTLASDAMRGRRAFTPDIDHAADFIANEFKSIGLQTWSSNTYRQEFSMISSKLISLSCTFDNNEVDSQNVVVVTSQPGFFVNEKSWFEKTVIGSGKNLSTEARKLLQSKKNLLVLVDTSYSKNFIRLTNLKRQLFKSDFSVVFVLSIVNPSVFTVEARHEITEQKLANVVGIIPGKSRKDEYVIFSGHYDHLGVTTKPVTDDSIYNGANDDAAGTTAVIMLAKYFKALKNNERTLVFVAFTAEEVGGYGSQYFSQQFDPTKVAAMFNIEMIGTESKWGKNSAYITGYEKTDMGTILQKNLEGTGFTFYPDPYTTQNLFYRSDNATLARLGVPAHTISTSKMDSEPNYHKLSDQVETLDMDNMAMIIKSVALSSKTIISGKDSPSRVKVDELR